MKKKTEKKKINSNTNLIIAGVIIVFLFILMTIIWIKRGTFAINDEEANVTITCPTGAKPGTNVVCDIMLNLDMSKKIMSINANYDLTEELSYVSFETDEECEEECFEIYANTENGFALVNTTGITSSILVGRLTIEIPDDITENADYKVGLKDIELSDEDFEMIELSPSSINIHIDEEEEEPDPGIIEQNETITRIKNNTTFGEIKAKYNLTSEVIIISNDGETVDDDDDIVKTGDKLQLANGTEITLSVLGDLTGDGLIKVNDVGKLYRHLKKRKIITEEYILAAGNTVNDDEIKVNDVSRIYRYVKGRITSLEVIE